MWVLVVFVVLVTPDGRLDRQGVISAPYATLEACIARLATFGMDDLPAQTRARGAVIAFEGGCVPERTTRPEQPQQQPAPPDLRGSV